MRAVTQGIGSAGNTLASAMQRYRLTREDAGDLTAFIRWPGTYRDPGITAKSICVGTVVPGDGPLAGAGRAIVASLFENQSALETADLERLAAGLGLDGEALGRAIAMEDPAVRLAVEADRRDGLRLGVDSTPALFVGGPRLEGRTRSAIAEAIEFALASRRGRHRGRGPAPPRRRAPPPARGD